MTLTILLVLNLSRPKKTDAMGLASCIRDLCVLNVASFKGVKATRVPRGIMAGVPKSL